MKVIFTKVLPNTNTKPTRVVAKTQDGHRIVVPFDDSTTNPHLYAAVMLVRAKNWAPVVLAGGGINDDEHAFVMLQPGRHLVAAVYEAAHLGHNAGQILHHVDA